MESSGKDQRYEIKKELARGGLGTVYLANDKQLNRDVAIKRLHPQEDIDPEDMHNELMRESRILSRLKSAHIVTVFDVGRDDDGSFVVMELLNGETLEELVSRAPMVEADFISVAQQSLEGVIAAHSGGLIHSDLKPENFMITWWPSGRFQVKLLDFGIASFVNAAHDEEENDPGSMMGSIYFMAPEQFKKKPVDARTDIYSLGCVFYYALTGRRPFDGENSAQVMASHIQNRFIGLDKARPDLDPRIVEMVHAMIAKDPDERFQTAIDVMKNVEYIQKTERPVVQEQAISSSGVRVNLTTAPAPAVAPEAGEVQEEELPEEENLLANPIIWIVAGVLFLVIIVVAYAVLSL